MKTTVPHLLSGQAIHFLALLLLLPTTWKFWVILERPFPVIFWTCILIPTFHQIFVWLSWRLELQNRAVSKSIGFKSYLIVFFIFLWARPLSLLYFAYLDKNTLGLSLAMQILLTMFFFIPAVYTAISIKRYFGFQRAAGADHFKPEYRNMPLVKKGIFKYTKNGMYLFGFFALWAIAFGFNSKASLIVAGYSHVSIWIHYYATEKPDMLYLYGQND